MADSANKELTAAAHALAEEEAGKESGLVDHQARALVRCQRQ